MPKPDAFPLSEAQVLSPRVTTPRGRGFRAPAQPEMGFPGPLSPRPTTGGVPGRSRHEARAGTFTYANDNKYAWSPTWRRFDTPVGTLPTLVRHRVAEDCELEPTFIHGALPHRQNHFFRGQSGLERSSTSNSGMPSPRGGRRDATHLTQGFVY